MPVFGNFCTRIPRLSMVVRGVLSTDGRVMTNIEIADSARRSIDNGAEAIIYSHEGPNPPRHYANSVQEICLERGVPFLVHRDINLAIQMDSGIWVNDWRTAYIARGFLQGEFIGVSVPEGGVYDLHPRLSDFVSAVSVQSPIDVGSPENNPGRIDEFLENIGNSPVPVIVREPSEGILPLLVGSNVGIDGVMLPASDHLTGESAGQGQISSMLSAMC